MVDFKKTASLIFFVCAVNTVQAEAITNNEKGCAHKKQNSISLSFVENIKENADIGAIYKDKVSLINNIAKKNGFKKYKITSQDISSSRSSYGNNMYDVYISINIEISPDYSAITTLFRESGANSFSSSQYEVEVCDDKK